MSHTLFSRPVLAFESLESRQLFTSWGTVPRMLGLDKLAEDYPALTGRGQTIAVIDTGIDYTHPALGGGFGPGYKVLGGFDFFENDNDPLDRDGHGTSVAGVIAADAFETGGLRYQGIAPDASLVALRVAETKNTADLAKIEAAFDWVIDHHEEFNIGIVNISFGFGHYSADFIDAQLGDELAQLASLNIVITASSGNDGLEAGQGIAYPGADPNVISVGSVDDVDTITTYTQRSSNLDMLAPGDSVYTLGLRGSYQRASGTSFASPAVAATAALVRQVDDAYTLGEVRSILLASGVENIDGDVEFGMTTGVKFSRLQAYNAVNLAITRDAASSAGQTRIGQNANNNDLAFDQFGVGHLVYFDSSLRTLIYATRATSGLWSLRGIVDETGPEMGHYSSLKIDSLGKPHVAYFDAQNGDLKYAKFDGVRWSNQTIESPGSTGLYPSMVLDAEDKPQIAFFRKQSADLRLASWTGANWSVTNIETKGNVGRSASLTYDAQKRLGVAFEDSGNLTLKLARQREGGTWESQVADGSLSGGAAFISLKFDAASRPHISYYDASPADLKYAFNPFGAWQHETVVTRGPVGLYTQLQLSANGSSIFYYDRRSNSLSRADRSLKGLWYTRELQANAGKFIAIALNPANGRTGVTFFDGTQGRLLLSEIA